jgi:hypothetical protein
MTAQMKPLILILVKRVSILAFVICAVSLFYWIVGSESSFLDETESMLLSFMMVSSLCVVAISGMGIILGIAFAVARRYRLRILGLLGYLATAVVGTVALLISQTVTILSRGFR